MIRRIFSLFLALALCMGTVPGQVFAQENTEPTQAQLCSHGLESDCGSCAAVAEVEAQIGTLPTPAEMLALDNTGRNEVYDLLLAVTELYDALGEDQVLVSNAQKMIDLGNAFAGLTGTAESGTLGTNVNWTLENGVLTFSGTGDIADLERYREDGEYFVDHPWSYRSVTSVVIQSGITGIGTYTFMDHDYLTSVSIASTVTKIGTGAFNNCPRITQINIPSGVTSIGSNAFAGARIPSFTIPDGITSISGIGLDQALGLQTISVSSSHPTYAVQSNVLFSKDMTTLVLYPRNRSGSSYEIPGTVTTISAGAFRNASLTSVVIPASVSSIGEYAFYASSLTSVTFNTTSLTTISKYAFNRCDFSSIVIPEGVTTIDDYAFDHCESMQTVTLPTTLKNVNGCAFDWCHGLTTVYYNGSEKDWAAITVRTNNNYLTKATRLTTEGNPLSHDWQAATCTTPKTCSVCGATEGEASGHSWTAATCTTPKTCSVCNTTEGNALGHTWVAATCTDPKTCSVCNATEGNALGHTWVAATCTDPKTCSVCNATEGSALGHNFADHFCTRCGATDYLAHGTDGSITWNITTGGVLTVSGTGPMADYSTLEDRPWDAYKDQITNVVVEADITSIGTNAFKGCGELTAATIGDNVLVLGDSSFSGCGKLNAVSFGAGVTTIGQYAFWDCESLTSVDLPDSLLVIEQLSFIECAGLSSITIPAGVTKIGAFAFVKSGLSTITFLGTTPPDIGNSVFAEMTVTAYYPASDLWTEEVRPDYGGTVTWEPYGTHTHAFIQNVADTKYLVSAATCTAAATYYYSCECGEKGSETFSYGSLLSHTWVAATCTDPKTCSVCNATEGDALGHTWLDATCTDPKTCSVCNATEGNALGHTWVDADCTTPKTCSVCNTTEGDALGHDEVSHEAQAPTATEAGWEAYVTCSRCDYSTYREVPALGGHPVQGLPAGSTVEIDGVTYPVDQSGSVILDSTGHKTATVYTYATSSTEDPNGVTAHQQYPTGMQVWQLVYNEAAGSYTPVLIEELTDFLTYRGTSIRYSTDPSVKNGIRVITGVPSDKRAALINGTLITNPALNGYRLVEYGTLIKRMDVPGAFVYGGAGVQSSVAFQAATGEDRKFSTSGGEIQFTGAFVGLSHDLCDDELLLRSYMILEKDGQQVVIHGGTLQRNIGYVAYQNRDFKPNQGVTDFIWGIIQAVYGDKVTQ